MSAYRMILLIVLLSPCPCVFGQSDSLNEERSRQLKRIFHQVAAGYEITADTDAEPKQLPLNDEPIMHWLNLDAKGIYLGSVFTWTHMHRPEVIGTIFTSDGTKERIDACEEFYGFSAEQLQVRSASGKNWHPIPSEKMQPIPGGPVPSESKQGRRFQVRKMSKEFSGRMNRIPC